MLIPSEPSIAGERAIETPSRPKNSHLKETTPEHTDVLPPGPDSIHLHQSQATEPPAPQHLTIKTVQNVEDENAQLHEKTQSDESIVSKLVDTIFHNVLKQAAQNGPTADAPEAKSVTKSTAPKKLITTTLVKHRRIEPSRRLRSDQKIRFAPEIIKNISCRSDLRVKRQQNLKQAQSFSEAESSILNQWPVRLLLTRSLNTTRRVPGTAFNNANLTQTRPASFLEPGQPDVSDQSRIARGRGKHKSLDMFPVSTGSRHDWQSTLAQCGSRTRAPKGPNRATKYMALGGAASALIIFAALEWQSLKKERATVEQIDEKRFWTPQHTISGIDTYNPPGLKAE